MGVTVPTASGPTTPAPEVGGLYTPPRTPTVVDVPIVTYLAVSGSGSPHRNLAWAEAVDRVRAGWYAVMGAEASPPPVEVIWEDGERTRWTLLLALPAGPPERRPAGCAVQALHEGWCVQVLYCGEADREPALARLERFLIRQGYTPRGRPGQVHEIFLDAVPDGAQHGAQGGTPPHSAPRVIARRPVRPIA
jgi:hypothetical protein